MWIIGDIMKTPIDFGANRTIFDRYRAFLGQKCPKYLVSSLQPRIFDRTFSKFGIWIIGDIMRTAIDFGAKWTIFDQYRAFLGRK